MLKKIVILLLILLGLAVAGYYVLYTQGAFEEKKVKKETSIKPFEMKCEAGKCAAGKCGAAK